LEETIEQSFTRSSSGMPGSAARSRTRRSKSSHDRSRFRNLSGRAVETRTVSMAALTAGRTLASRYTPSVASIAPDRAAAPRAA